MFAEGRMHGRSPGLQSAEYEFDLMTEVINRLRSALGFVKIFSIFESVKSPLVIRPCGTLPFLIHT